MRALLCYDRRRLRSEPSSPPPQAPTHPFVPLTAQRTIKTRCISTSNVNFHRRPAADNVAATK